jgi:hypothetical protein
MIGFAGPHEFARHIELYGRLRKVIIDEDLSDLDETIAAFRNVTG